MSTPVPPGKMAERVGWGGAQMLFVSNNKGFFYGPSLGKLPGLLHASLKKGKGRIWQLRHLAGIYLMTEASLFLKSSFYRQMTLAALWRIIQIFSHLKRELARGKEIKNTIPGLELTHASLCIIYRFINFTFLVKKYKYNKQKYNI